MVPVGKAPSLRRLLHSHVRDLGSLVTGESPLPRRGPLPARPLGWRGTRSGGGRGTSAWAADLAGLCPASSACLLGLLLRRGLRKPGYSFFLGLDAKLRAFEAGGTSLGAPWERGLRRRGGGRGGWPAPRMFGGRCKESPVWGRKGSSGQVLACLAKAVL